MRGVKSMNVEDWRPSEGNRAIIYLITHLASGKRYIGYTVVPLLRRATRHMANAKFGKGTACSRLARALLKYGFDAFTVTVLKRCVDHAEALRDEAALIDELHPEYNITAGGLGAVGYRHGPEALAKMRAWRDAHPDWKPRLGTGITRYKTYLGAYTPARRQQLLDARAVSAAAISKAVICLNTGAQYPSARAAALALDLNARSLASVCNPSRPQKSLRGLRFQYVGGEN